MQKKKEMRQKRENLMDRSFRESFRGLVCDRKIALEQLWKKRELSQAQMKKNVKEKHFKKSCALETGSHLIVFEKH